ncbi:HIG1 domain family member 2A, mitochondrial-like [Corticium candelabrum]|uniref:HIG1 domain family member 2A, mitochondrial-like n=1 Tax=Corticium candelabrum TaxID=121492 RepID=UPI002E258308|nr:HIG1 domain family member 2A, mitochondrial-like [Corticium candelabrum]
MADRPTIVDLDLPSWTPPPPPETTKQRLIRRIKENPFVPMGLLGTVAALTYGLASFKRGRVQMSQYMMRVRVLAQGATVLAILIGVGLSAVKRPKTIKPN